MNSEVAGKTTKAAAVEKIKAHHGAVPYGWQRDLYGRLIELVEEQQNIEQMRRYRAGGETLRSIKSGMGLRLSLATIARICSAKQDEVEEQGNVGA